MAGNFSGYWLGLAIMGLMTVAYLVSERGLRALMLAPAVFAFGLVAFGFLGMGPVTIAVDSYGPVTDNAQSVYELSQIEEIPTVRADVKRDFGFEPNFAVAKDLLEENDGAGNTFKATAKPVLIGTAVVGSTTMIFSIIMALTHGLTENLQFLSILHPPFLLGLITGGAVIYWFTGASMQAVSTGAYRAVEFIKKNIKLEGTTRASVADSRKVVEICTLYAQKGMFNIFLGVFFSTLAFAFIEPYFFIGYLISIALFGLYQAIFMANAGGAWDNAKKIVETELKMKGTDLHAASIVGDTVGDPFKDTSSVAMNPVIKFTTLFGLLAVELGVYLAHTQGPMLGRVLSLAVLPRQHRVRVAVVLPDADRDRGTEPDAPAMILLAAVAVFALATAGLVLLIEPIPGWYYTLAWWSYIVAVDDVNRRLGGRSLLRYRFRHLAYLACASVLWWTLFEIVNLRLGNWYYVMSPAGRPLRWASGVVAFATVLPGIVVTVTLIENLGWLRTVRVAPLVWTPRKTRRGAGPGRASVLLPLAWPDVFYPLIWGSAVFLLEPWNRDHARRSFLRDLEQGEAGPFVRTLLAGLVCGGLWELWNYWARTKWIYTVPGFEELKLFEMPVLGFLGVPAVRGRVPGAAAVPGRGGRSPRRGRPPACAAGRGRARARGGGGDVRAHRSRDRGLAVRGDRRAVRAAAPGTARGWRPPACAARSWSSAGWAAMPAARNGRRAPGSMPACCARTSRPRGWSCTAGSATGAPRSWRRSAFVGWRISGGGPPRTWPRGCAPAIRATASSSGGCGRGGPAARMQPMLIALLLAAAPLAPRRPTRRSRRASSCARSTRSS